MLGVLSIILTLIMLMFFAYKGVTVLVLAPLLAMLATVLSGEFPALYAWTGMFMPAAANYLKSYFPVFLTGAIFGKLMGVSGAAKTIAHFIAEKIGKEKAIFAIVLATALLTYGGVSLFVVVFAMYPIGATLLREANMPKRLLPAAIALGAFTFTMTALPGSPQYINTMPTIYFGTDIYAGTVLGLLGSIIMFGMGTWWLNFRAKKAMAAGEGYGDHPNENFSTDTNLPKPFVSFAPIILVFIINFVLTNVYFKSETVVAKYANYGGINGTWSVVIALSVAILLCLFSFKDFIKQKNQTVFDGAVGSLLPIFNTASEVGYGGVIKSLAAFTTLKVGLIGIAMPAIFKVAISSTVLAAVAGSASGGLGIALEVLGEEFASMNINPEAIHRIMVMAAGGLDSLPHNGAVITLLSVCHLNHKQSYMDLGFCTVLTPLVATLICMVFYLVTGIV
ncbi:MAG: GntP family permease [Tissierellales bacterium]|nr:GntP family permease [Tissierellales bacterium]MBN2826673.1 GntP family permease [Tissierellales bacterium]